MVVQIPGPPWTAEKESQSIHLSKQISASLVDVQVEDTVVSLSDNQSLVYKSGINMVIKQEKSYEHETKADMKDSFIFAVPAKKAPSNQTKIAPLVEWKNTLNMRQVMLGNLAARREQFDASLGRTSNSSTARARSSSTRPGVGAARSLDLLRINLQAAINKDIQQVLNKYLERFFQPAMENIRSNLGSESVADDHVRAVCQRVLEEAKQMYLTSFQSETKSKSERIRESHKWHQTDFSPAHASHPSHPTSKSHLKVQLANRSYQQLQLKPQVQNFPNLRSACGGVVQQNASTHYKWQASAVGTPMTNQNMMTRKRKEIECDLEANHRKRNRTCELPSGQPVTAASRFFQVTPINYQGLKWDPARITKDTLFVMGARANKVLGFGQTRGRLYLKHHDLFKYCADQQDREWLAQHNLMAPSSGKAYLMVMQDIHELALSDEYKNNPNVMLQELKGFRAPEFLLNKIRSYLSSLRTEPLADLSELLDIQFLPEFCDKEGKLSFESGPSSATLLDSGVPPMDESLMELALEYGVTLMSEGHNQLDVPNQLSSSSTVLATLPPSLEALTQGVNSSRSASSCSSLSPSVSPSPPCLPVSPVDSPNASTSSPTSTSTCSSKSTGVATASVSAAVSSPRAAASPLEPSSTSTPGDIAKSDSSSVPCSSVRTAESETKPLLKAETNQSLLESQNLSLSLELPISPTLEELELLIKTESCLSGNGHNEGSLNTNARGPSGNTILVTLDPQTDVFDQIMRANDGVAEGDKNSLSSSVGSQTTPDLNLDAGLDASLDANLDLNLDVNLDVNLDTMTEATALEIAYLGLMLDSDASNSDLHAQSQSNNENYSQISIPLEGNLGENALAMSHATLSALLSGNTLEGLEIPDALL